MKYLFLLIFTLCTPFIVSGQCSFTASNLAPCAGETVTFAVDNPLTEATYTWDLDEDGIVDTSGTSFDFVFPGSSLDEVYNILLFENGDTCSLQTIIATAGPDVNIGVPPGIVTLDSNTIKVCNGSGNFELSIFNNSATFANNTSYTINWGDGTPAEDYDNTTFSPSNIITHTYNGLGYYTIFITAVHENGCVYTRNYVFYNGGNPSVGMSLPGNTVGLCAPATLEFPITNTEGNPPGTEYTVYIGGAEVAHYTQDSLPAAFVYTFEESSCGQTTSTNNYENAFDIRIVASNPCNSSTATIEPIEISSPPELNFSITPPASSCAGSVFSFADASVNVNEVISGNPSYCLDVLNPSWTISGVDGEDWSVVSGNLFSSNAIDIEFLTPGVYTIEMTVVSFSCGPFTISQEITVYEPPQVDADASFVDVGGGGDTGCAPLTIPFSNNSTGDSITYSWEVVSDLAWEFTDSLGATLPNTSITFSEGGTYQVIMNATNPCATVSWDTTIILPGPPLVALDPIPDYCASASLQFDSTNFIFLENGSPITGYHWVFDGGTPEQADSAYPNGITYDSAGFYGVQVAVSNACGTTTVTDTFLVQEMTMLLLPPDTTLCGSNAPFPLNFSPLGGSWSGPGVSSGGVFDPTLAQTGANTLTYSYGTGACFLEASFNVNILAAPTVNVGPDQTICTNDGNVALTASPGNGQWLVLDSASVLNGTTFLTAASGAGPHDLVYEVVDGNQCRGSDTLSILVQMAPEVMVGDSSYCNTSGATPLPEPLPSNGIWSGPGVVDPTGLFDPAVAGGAGSYQLTYSVTANNGCITNAAVDIGVIDPTNVDAGPDVSLCAYDDPYDLAANANPAGGRWLSGSDGLSNGLFNPTVAGAGTYLLRYRVGAGSCRVEDTLSITVVAPAAAESGPNQSVCIDENPFDLSGYSPVGGLWSGTGITNAQNGTFDPEVATPGNHTLTYTVLDPATGCGSLATKNIRVHSVPVADFTGPAVSCLAGEVNFTNTATDGDSFTWEFGDGNTSTATQPTHIYQTVGSYTVALTVINSAGCVAATTRDITVTAPPTAQFAPDTDAACGQLNLQVDNQSIGYQNTYFWSLGNGETSTAQQPPGNITYPAGVNDTMYVISLEASNLCGSDQYLDTVLVHPFPLVEFGFSVDTGCAPLMVSFANISTGSIEAFFWDFGNGQTSTDSLPEPQGFMGDTIPVVYPIQLVATNACGTDTLIRELIVQPHLVSAFFNISNTQGCAPLTLDFENFSTLGTTVNWDFGDGNTSSATDPIHTFTEPGEYTITQYAANACAEDQISRQITVLASPEVDFTLGNNRCAEQAIQFTSTASNLAGLHWDFGTGDTSNLNHPTYIFPEEGDYTVTLTATALGSGCTANTSQNVQLVAGPVVQLTADSLTGCTPLTVQFASEGSQGDFYVWDFGDGNTSVATAPVHTYQAAGDYAVNLRVSNQLGCEVDTLLTGVAAYRVPEADFTYEKAMDCGLPVLVEFTNQSTEADGATWYFGNDLVSDTYHPSQTFYSSGLMAVQMMASNQFGCRDSSTQELLFYEQPIAEFALDSMEGCQPLLAAFTNYSVGNRYFWDFGDGHTSEAPQPVHEFTEPGEFDVALVAAFDDVCADTLRLDGLVQVHPTPTASFTWSPEILDGTPTGLIQFVNTSNHAHVFLWEFGDGEGSDAESPAHRYYQNDDWQVYLLATHSSGCQDDTLVVIQPEPLGSLFVPNAFAPDQGLGDAQLFFPKGLGLKEYQLQIFSPYGELLWENTELQEGQPAVGWDGTHHGALLPQDVYVWKIRAIFEDGTEWPGVRAESGGYKRMGSVTLIR